jgi:hypothetical protein
MCATGSVDSGASEGAEELLARLPDLGDALRKAPIELKQQAFEAFCLNITYDMPNRRIEISATITEAIAHALENEETSRRRSPLSLEGT